MCCTDVMPIRTCLKYLSFRRSSYFITILKNYPWFSSCHTLYPLSLLDSMAVSLVTSYERAWKDAEHLSKALQALPLEASDFHFSLGIFHTYPFTNLIHFFVALKKKILWLQWEFIHCVHVWLVVCVPFVHITDWGS